MSGTSETSQTFPLSISRLLANIPTETLFAVGEDLRNVSVDEQLKRYRELVRLNPSLGMIALAHARIVHDGLPLTSESAFISGVQFTVSALLSYQKNSELEQQLSIVDTPAA